MINIGEIFNNYQDEYLEFEKIENKFSNRPDLHAFILLDKIIPGDSDIVSYSEHDEFYLSIDTDELAKFATEEQIVDLIRCGVQYNDSEDCLYMFP